MGDVEEEPQFVHSAHDVHPEAAEPGVRAFEAAVAEQIPGVVGELNDADAQTAQLFESSDVVLQGCRVLRIINQRDRPPRGRAIDIGDRLRARKPVRMGRDVAVVHLDFRHHIVESGWAVQRRVAHRNHTGPEAACQDGVEQRRFVIDANLAQTVDHGRGSRRLTSRHRQPRRGQTRSRERRHFQKVAPLPASDLTHPASGGLTLTGF